MNEVNLKPRILLAEDNEMNRKVVQLMLEKKGFSCQEAVNGRDAINEMLRNEYDIVLMDCQMPILDGFLATKEIREIEKGKKHTIIIAMTASAMQGDKEMCINAGMDDYVSKPIDYIDLVKKINEYWGIISITKEGAARMKEDWTKIDFMVEGLKDFMDRNGFDEKIGTKLYSEYVLQLPKSVTNMEMSLGEGNMEDLSRHAHQLKGSSGMLRISVMAELCLKLEMAAKSGDKVESSLIIDKIKFLFDL